MEKVCSKNNRTLFMGLAIIAITICHINQFIGVHKGLQTGIANEFLFASAAVGVDMFFFFSLIGLGFSLENNNLIIFYKRRINRIYPIYFLFLLIVLAVFYRDESLSEKWILLGQQISGLSATLLVPQRIEWYVPSLLILYAFYPLFFSIVKRIHESRHNRKLEILILGSSVLFSYLFGRFCVGLFSMRLPLYYLAILSYFYVKEGKSRSLIDIYIYAACCSFVVKNEILSYALLIPLFFFFSDEVIDSWKATRSGKFLSWLGQYTLEIYLAQVIATKYLIKELPTNNILLITCIVFITTAFLAFVLNRFHYFINSSLTYLTGEIRQSYSSVRLSWVDAAKGCAMFIIMWGHIQQPSSLKMWLTSFHVPLFLVLSGILMAKKSHVGGGKIFYEQTSISISDI